MRWNFHSQAMNAVFENKEDLLQCFKTLRDSGEFDSFTAKEGGGIAKLLLDDRYQSQILPYLSCCVDVWGNTYKISLKLLLKLQKRALRIVH